MEEECFASASAGSTQVDHVAQVTLSPRQAAKRYGFSVQFMYDRLNSGEIHSVKVGGRRFVSVVSADRVFGVATHGDEPTRLGMSAA